MEQGLDEKIIQRVIKACSESLNPIHLMDEERVRHNLQKQLEAELRVQSPSATLANRVMCLVGTSGSGKTSACAKLAAFFSKIMEKKVVWICADTIRTGAIGEARMYTDALNIPLHVVYTPADLVQAIESEADAQMILVDFPACNPRSEVKVIEMGSFLTAINKRTTYFVAPATSKETDLMDMLAAFSPFNIKGLIFTKMDETSVYGNLYNIAWRSQLPLTFFANGTRIMDDLFPGQEKDLVSAIFRKGFAK
jgi:flagellar biosynthesis protein FlhF